MDIMEYFKKEKGFGILSTADDKGRVDAAVYASPHIIDDKNIAFVMTDKLSHANISKNPYAVYLFRKDGPGYEGKRLYIKKVKETKDQSIIKNMCTGPYCFDEDITGSFAVYFTVEKVLPLVGDK